MTIPTPPGSDLDTIVSRTRHLLLDFDGPICSIFAGLPAATVADRLRKLFGDHAQLPDDVARTPDPLEVFAYADNQNEWKDLDDPKEAIRFAARFGPGGLRIDPEGRSCNAV